MIPSVQSSAVRMVRCPSLPLQPAAQSQICLSVLHPERASLHCLLVNPRDRPGRFASDTVPVPCLCLLSTVGTQHRQQPPISLICSQRTAVSRKRNKKKKVLPKTVEPVTVKPKPGPLETEKKPAAVATRPSGLQATEHTSSEERHVLGFGIVLESPSSDVSRYIFWLTT